MHNKTKTIKTISKDTESDRERGREREKELRLIFGTIHKNTMNHTHSLFANRLKHIDKKHQNIRIHTQIPKEIIIAIYYDDSHNLGAIFIYHQQFNSKNERIICVCWDLYTLTRSLTRLPCLHTIIHSIADFFCSSCVLFLFLKWNWPKSTKSVSIYFGIL